MLLLVGYEYLIANVGLLLISLDLNPNGEEESMISGCF